MGLKLIGDTLDGQRARQICSSSSSNSLRLAAVRVGRCGQQCCVFERCIKNDLNLSGGLGVTCCDALTYRTRLKVTFGGGGVGHF